MNINQATSWILNRGTRKGPYSLDKISFLLEELDNPQYDFASILVGGTNGKGSVCTILNSILTKTEDYSIGLFTSPHLISMKERRVVCGKEVPDKLWCEGVKKIRDVCKIMDKDASFGPPAFFEIITALAFWIFRELEVDLAIVEVGLGGRFDSTNACSPEVAAITNIGMDHMEFLGETKEKIAEEKLKIVRKRRPLITTEEDENILSLFKTKLKKSHSKIITPKTEDYFQVKESNLEGHMLTVKATGEDVHFPMIGKHQLKNLTLALAIVEQLKTNGFEITEENISSGIKSSSWQGRLQWLTTNPKILLDGAHNPESIEALASFLSSFKEEKGETFNIIFGALKDKTIKDMVAKLAPFGNKLYFVSPNCPRRLDLEDFKALNLEENWSWVDNLEEAICLCSEDKDRPTLICGSLYLISEALALYQ